MKFTIDIVPIQNHVNTIPAQLDHTDKIPPLQSLYIQDAGDYVVSAMPFLDLTPTSDLSYWVWDNDSDPIEWEDGEIIEQ